jgi:hypothetical protein
MEDLSYDYLRAHVSLVAARVMQERNRGGRTITGISNRGKRREIDRERERERERERDMGEGESEQYNIRMPD